MNSFLRIKWARVSIATSVLAIGAAAAAGCAKDSSGGGGSSGSGGFGLGGAGGLVGGTGGSGGAGNGAGGRGSGGSGSGGSGGAGSGGSGAVAGTGGMSGTGGAAGSGGSAGGTTGALHGGSSAKFICQPGATYGNPLPTSIVVTQIGPPTTPPANYFAFIEGPIWIGSLQTLFFSDNASQPQERIFSLVPPSTTPRDFMELSGSNGMAVDNNDKLIVGDQRNMRITRVDPVTAQTLDIIVPAGLFKPNDVIVRSDNNIYFTDSLSGVAIGLYRVSAMGVVTGPMKQLTLANGIALSLDENTLFVGDQGSRQIHRFTLAPDGSVNTASDQVFATTMGQTLDGMCMDCAGNLYAGTGNGVEVYSPTGTYVGTVPTGESSNCTFGGADRKTIYVTSRMVLKVATLNVPGLPD